jgi:hypothetical protein
MEVTMPDTEARIRIGMREIADTYRPGPDLGARIERTLKAGEVERRPVYSSVPVRYRRHLGRVPAIAWALTLLVLVAAIVFVTVRTGSPSHGRAGATSSTNHVSSNKSSPKPATDAEVPQACTAKPVLAPQSPTPLTWPTNFEILNVMPGVLASQYPTVYDNSGLAGPQNSEYIVSETVHDPALEAEVRRAASGTKPPMPTTFVIVPHSLACLKDVQSEVGSSVKMASGAGISIYGFGLQTNDVIVNIANCGASATRATSWFKVRWGTLTRVVTCRSMPIAGTAESSVNR